MTRFEQLYGIPLAKRRRMEILIALMALEIIFAFSYLGFIIIPPISITTMHLLVMIAAIRQAITRAIADQARTIRIPVHMVETINKLIRVSRQLLQEKGREPQPEEIAEAMGISVEKVREIIKIAQEPVSLETPIGEEEDSHLGDFIQDDDAPPPAEAASFTLMKEQLMGVLDTLTPREKKVLSLRFGLEDGRQRTLEEVGQEFNVTRERIRQIEAKALRKLRHPSRSKKLKDYLE